MASRHPGRSRETVRAMALPDEAEQRHGESDRMGAHVPGALWPVDSLPVLGVERRQPHGKDQVRSQPLRFDPHPSSVMPGRVRPRLAQVQQSGTQGHCTDEANYKMVTGNKALFQAALEQVPLGQSTCNAYSYQVWLYAVPLIVSCNEWMQGADAHEQEWLDKISVVVNVTEPLWRDEVAPKQNA